jgi:hypothetical protein
MPTQNRHLEELMKKLGIPSSGDSVENDHSEPTDQKQEDVRPDLPQQDEAECNVPSPWAA